MKQNKDMYNDIETWVANRFATGIPPPFSFTYAGKPSEQFIRDWKFSRKKKQLDNVQTERIFTYEDPETKLQVRCGCIVFKDFPAIGWAVRFKNHGKVDTPVIEDIQALDTSFTTKEKGDFILHRALGSTARRDDFAPVDELIKHVLRRAPIGGRSSNTTAFPFFNIEVAGEGGVMVGIGWSGQWAASFARDEGSSLHVRAGMELTHLKLHSGEEIRTPRILLLFWQGDDYLLGHNLLRRFIVAHRMPKKDGKPVTLPFACSSSALYDESNRATEQNQIDFASRFTQYGVECLWIDAGWFEGRWPNGVGNWFIRKDGFPNGLRPVTDALKKMGMGLILWFEPERVYQSHTYGISLYLPSTSTGNAYPDVYSFRSSINNGIVLGWNVYHPDIPSLWKITPPGKEKEPFPVEQARLLAEEFKSIRDFFFGDFHPLTPHSITDDTWIAFQFHREDLRQGIVLAFRRHKCPITTIRLKLNGLLPTARYEVHFKDIHIKRTFIGKHLGDGLDVTIEGAPGSSLIIYRQLS